MKKWWKKAAEQGEANAQFALGSSYQHGRGTEQDAKLVEEWSHRAADQGHVHAQFNLGLLYYEARGIPKDETLAIDWWTKAGEQSNVKAQFSLGPLFYDDGMGSARTTIWPFIGGRKRLSSMTLLLNSP